MIIGPKEEVDELAEEAIDAASKKKNIRLCVALFFFFFLCYWLTTRSRIGKAEEAKPRRTVAGPGAGRRSRPAKEATSRIPDGITDPVSRRQRRQGEDLDPTNRRPQKQADRCRSSRREVRADDENAVAGGQSKKKRPGGTCRRRSKQPERLGWQ